MRNIIKRVEKNTKGCYNMEKKLNILYNECVDELKTIGIDLDNKEIGKIDVKLSKRNTKRYGCCKQEEPDKSSMYIEKQRNHRTKKYSKFLIHHIEISKWLMNLNDEIIKNTIMHEIIHCFPYCNNHGKYFKEYANFINKNLGYNITRLGNKEEDYKKSNLEYINKENYKYKIECQKCGQIIYRQRLNKNLITKYRCGKCNGKLKLLECI